MTDRNETAPGAAQRPQDRYKDYDGIRARNAAYGRQMRAWRREQGLCTACGTSKAAPGYRICDLCRKVRNFLYRRSPEQQRRHAEYKHALYQQRVAAGLCISCGKAPAREGRRMCAACADVFNALARARNHKEDNDGNA